MLPTERSLLKSSRIDRKTILLNQMRTIDAELQGGQSIYEVQQMNERQAQLVKKLGPVTIRNMVQEHLIKATSLDPLDTCINNGADPATLRRSLDSADSSCLSYATSAKQTENNKNFYVYFNNQQQLQQNNMQAQQQPVKQSGRQTGHPALPTEEAGTSPMP